MFRIGVIGYGSRLNSCISTVDMVGGAELVAVTDIVDKKEYLEENGHFGPKLCKARGSDSVERSPSQSLQYRFFVPWVSQVDLSVTV